MAGGARPKSSDTPWLVGDVGATNARFARVVGVGEVTRIRVFACSDYRRIEDAIDAYLAEAAPRAIA